MSNTHNENPTLNELLSRFETRVKPYYEIKKTEDCYIGYFSHSKSAEHKITRLTVEEVYEKFGFLLVCDDFTMPVGRFYDKAKNVTKEYPELADFFPVPMERGRFLTNPLNKFVVYEQSPKMGLGLMAYSSLPKGISILEYVGEILDINTNNGNREYFFNNRGLELIKDGTEIAWNRYDTVIVTDLPPYQTIRIFDHSMIDPKYIGNMARFINHCPNHHDDYRVLTANLNVMNLMVPGDQPKTIFITNRDIKASEPLCFDYGKYYDFKEPVILLDKDTYEPLNDGYFADGEL